jgi:hypothetical protein
MATRNVFAGGNTHAIANSATAKANHRGPVLQRRIAHHTGT